MLGYKNNLAGLLKDLGYLPQDFELPQ